MFLQILTLLQSTQNGRRRSGVDVSLIWILKGRRSQNRDLKVINSLILS